VTGMVPWFDLHTAEPLTVAMNRYNLAWAAGIVAVVRSPHTPRCCSCSSSASRAFSSRWRAMACCPRRSPKSTPSTARRTSRRSSGCAGGGVRELRQHRGDGGPYEYRHAVRVRSRLGWRDRAPATYPRRNVLSMFPSSRGCRCLGRGLPVPRGRTAAHHLGTLRVWLVAGLTIYIFYSHKRSAAQPPPAT